MIYALVFDFDGLILDTETPDYESWREVYQAHGAELALAEWVVCVGGSNESFDPYSQLEQRIGCAVDREQIRTTRRLRMQEMISGQEPLPGVLDYITTAQRLGLKLAVASSSDADWVHGHLTHLGLHSSFDAIRTKNDVTQVKPDPALYLAAVDALDVAPHQALALEDSANGLTAAKRAGLYCAVVPNAITHNLDFSLADARLTSLAERPLEQLLREVMAAKRTPSGCQIKTR